jgi:predicted Zn-dependent protease with MMP-like domain
MKTWEEISQSIARLIAAGEMDEAEKELRKVARQFNDEPSFHLLKGDTLWAGGDVEGGFASYQKALDLAPDSIDCMGAMALALYEFVDFKGAYAVATRALDHPDLPDTARADLYDLLSCLAERDGDFKESDRLSALATTIDPDAYPPPYRLTAAKFQKIADHAVEDLPEEFLRALRENLAMVIEPVPPVAILESEDPPLSPSLLGLYTGVPLPERESSTSPPSLPDVIHLFQRNIEREASNADEIRDQITITVYHEIGHYFGMDEDELEALDLD